MRDNSMKFSQSCRVMSSNAGGLIGRDKPDMDSSLDMLKRPQVLVCILGIVLLASAVRNSGEERCIFGHVFPERHAYYNSALKRPSANSILKLKRPPLWGPILRMETLSQSSVAGNMGESARFDDKGIAFFYSAKVDGFCEFRLKGQLPACSWSGSLQVEFKEYAHGLDELGLKGQPPAFLGVSSFQAKFKEHAQGQSSSGPAGGSGARDVERQRTGNRGGNNGRIGRAISRIADDGRRDDGDDDDNDPRMVGDEDNGRGPRDPRVAEILEIYLPIVIQTLVALVQIDVAQLSEMDRLIRCFAVVTNLLAFLCCLFVIRQPNMNKGKGQVLCVPKWYQSLGMDQRVEQLEQNVTSLLNNQQQMLEKVTELFRLYEARNASQRKIIQPNTTSSQVTTPVGTDQPDSRSPSMVRRMSQAKLKERMEKGLCYNCNEKFVPVHRCKKLFFLVFIQYPLIIKIGKGQVLCVPEKCRKVNWERDREKEKRLH